MARLPIRNEEKQGVWTLIITYYLVLFTVALGGIYGFIGWICLILIGLVFAKLLLKSTENEKEVKNG